MGSTMLQLVQQATSELGVPVPTYVVGNTNQDVIQINALMNAVGYELLRKADWQQLVKQNIFTTTYTQSNGFTVSGDSYTIYGLDSNVASLNSDYQVVGNGVGNATYITAVTDNGGGVYSVTVNQPLTAYSSSASTVTLFCYTSSYTGSSTTIASNQDPSTYGIIVGQFVTGQYIQSGTQITGISYDAYNAVWVYTLSKTTLNDGGNPQANVNFISYATSTFTFQKVKYAMPTDYDATIPRTHWDKSKRWEMLGPEDAQQWEWLLSGYISTGPRIRWRIFQGKFQIWPGISYNELLGFEYRSKAWAEGADGTAKNSFTADTDTCIYPDRLMVLGTKLKYFEAKGFDTTAMYRDYLSELETSIAQNTSAANLSFAPRPGTVLIGYDNIPDSGFGN